MVLMKNQQKVLDLIKDKGPIKKEDIVQLTNLTPLKVQNILSEFYDGELINRDINGVITLNTRIYAHRNENSAHEENHWKVYKLKNLSRVV